MRIAFKKCRNLTEENKKKEIKINQLENSLKVSDTVFAVDRDAYFQEKNKLLNRFHIYSWKKSPASLQKSVHSISTVNLSSTEKDSLIETLESRLSKKSRDSEEQVDQIAEKPSVPVSNEPMRQEEANGDCDNTADNCDGETSGNDSATEAESTASDEESEASEAVDENVEEKAVEEKEDTNTFQEKKDVSLSPREKIVGSMSTAEKVKIWLPQAQTTGRDIQISIDESQKVALLAKLNEIDSDKGAIEATEDRLLSSTSVPKPPSNNNNNHQVERKVNLMEQLFGEAAILPRQRKDTYSLGSRPLKTSLRTSPSASGPAKSVKFVEED